MDKIIQSIGELKAQCCGLKEMDLETVTQFLDSLQECFLDMLSAEPKKTKKTEHQLWKTEFKELKSIITSVEAQEEKLYEERYPKLRHYCQLIEQEHSDAGWVKLKREIDEWLSASAPHVAAEFEQQGYKEMLDGCCEGFNFEEEPEPRVNLWKYSPIPCFAKYLPLIYAVDELWDSFQLYVRSELADKGQDFFAFHRSPEAMAVWPGVIENMGGGIPISVFASAAYLILHYKELGHDLDKELESLKTH